MQAQQIINRSRIQCLLAAILLAEQGPDNQQKQDTAKQQNGIVTKCGFCVAKCGQRIHFSCDFWRCEWWYRSKDLPSYIIMCDLCMSYVIQQTGPWRKAHILAARGKATTCTAPCTASWSRARHQLHLSARGWVSLLHALKDFYFIMEMTTELGWTWNEHQDTTISILQSC